MHGRKSSIAELTSLMQLFSRESVIYTCSVTGIILKLWERGGWDHRNYEVLISGAFEFIRGDWYKVAAQLPEPELVFHRRQLLFLMKLAIEYCPKEGRDLLKTPPGLFGTILLMANDHFHHGLFPSSEAGNADEIDNISRVAAEFVPVSEYSGFRIGQRLTRSHLMITKYVPQLRNHPDYIDIATRYEELTGLSLLDYESLAFGLVARCIEQITLESLRQDASVAAIRPENFRDTAIPIATVNAFLSEFADTPEGFAASIMSSRAAKRDFGPNDLTIFRKRPLITEGYGSLASDVTFVSEKFETGPYWRISATDKPTGDRLHRFWGAVFELYMNDLIGELASGAGIPFIPDPRLITNENIQICDGILVEGDALVVIEYKSNMFTARAKYSGDHVLLQNEIENKLVRDSVRNQKKGVQQLRSAVDYLFSDPDRETVYGLNVSGIRRVYPLLITLDDIGGSLLISTLLNFFFDQTAPNKSVEVRPLFCMDAESLEVVLPHLTVHPLSSLLQHWLDNDPRLMAPLLARVPAGMLEIQNGFLEREWKVLNNIIRSRLFPQEHAVRQNN